MAAAPISLAIKHYYDSGVERIEINWSAASGSESSNLGSEEKHVLDWTERATSDRIFGPVINKSKRIKLTEVGTPEQQGGWREDTVETGLVEMSTESDQQKSGRFWTCNEVSKWICWF